MQQEVQIGSLIAIDVGSVNTKAVLVTQVEGVYRFIARADSATTMEAPWADVTIGVRHALEKLADAVGRKLLDERGDLIVPEQPEGGVDACVVTASSARPLRVVLAGLAGEWSLESLRRAAMGTYVILEDEISFTGRGKTDGRSDSEDRIQRMYEARPDVICIAGGTDGGASRPVLELVEAASWAARLMKAEDKPRIVYAGNSNLRRRIAEIVGEQAELLVAESNVRPELDVENIGAAQTELEVVYATHKMKNIPGYPTLDTWTGYPMLPSARAFGHVVQYLSANDPKHGVLGVDIGASTTTIAAAFDGQLYMTLRSDMGTSFGGQRLLRNVGWKRIARWLDFEVTEGELIEFAINKELHPITIPADVRELHIEQAFAREMIRATLRSSRGGWPSTATRVGDSDVPNFALIIGSGGVLARAPRVGQAALVMLDALELVGQSSLVLDVYGLGVALGAMAMAEPLASVQAIDQSGLVMMAHVVAPIGRMRSGDVAMTLKLEYEEGGTIEDEVKAGSLSVLPLSPGQKAIMHLQPRAGVDVGFGVGRGGSPTEIRGSALGLIIDARGRPLSLPANLEQRIELVKSWLWDMGA